MMKGFLNSSHTIFKDEREFGDRALDMSKEERARAKAAVRRATETPAQRVERKKKRMMRGLVGS